MKTILFTSLAFAMCSAVWGQAAPDAAGHWEGVVRLPDRQVRVAFDLARNSQGEWTGAMAMPEQKIDGLELVNIELHGASLRPMTKEKNQGLEAEISADGQALKGGFLSAFILTVPQPLEMKKAPAQKAGAAARSTAISKGFEGAWEGTVKFGAGSKEVPLPEGKQALVRVKLAAADGRATGTFTGSDGKEVPVFPVIANGSALHFEIRTTGAAFNGALRGGRLEGEWSLFGADPAPLALSRVAGAR